MQPINTAAPPGEAAENCKAGLSVCVLERVPSVYLLNQGWFIQKNRGLCTAAATHRQCGAVRQEIKPKGENIVTFNVVLG